MDLTTALLDEQQRLVEPSHRTTVDHVVAQGRRARARRRRAQVTTGVAAAVVAVGAGGAGVVLGPSAPPSLPVAASSSPVLESCGAAVEGGRLVLARGTTLVERVDGAVAPHVAPHSAALDLRLASGETTWVVWGWNDRGVVAGGCDTPDQRRDLADFDDFVRDARDGNGMSLG